MSYRCRIGEVRLNNIHDEGHVDLKIAMEMPIDTEMQFLRLSSLAEIGDCIPDGELLVITPSHPYVDSARWNNVKAGRRSNETVEFFQNSDMRGAPSIRLCYQDSWRQYCFTKNDSSCWVAFYSSTKPLPDFVIKRKRENSCVVEEYEELVGSMLQYIGSAAFVIVDGTDSVTCCENAQEALNHGS